MDLCLEQSRGNHSGQSLTPGLRLKPSLTKVSELGDTPKDLLFHIVPCPGLRFRTVTSAVSWGSGCVGQEELMLEFSAGALENNRVMPKSPSIGGPEAVSTK